MNEFILTAQCPDRPGIVRALAEGIYASKGNILENAQFTDVVTGTFCIRTHFESPESQDEVSSRVVPSLAVFDPVVSLRAVDRRRRAIIMVSKLDHCLVDLLYRWQIGELPVEIAAVVSNHPDQSDYVTAFGIPFIHLPVTPESKPAAELRLLELVAELNADFVVLARYMQVLSDDLCQRLAGRVINIHHSFLPGFKGARPYHRAFDRGVKLIGATAHYVTGDLDEGPIIEQDVVRVSHASSAEDLVAVGRDVERRVLARAVRLHAEDRVALTGHRTVIFD